MDLYLGYGEKVWTANDKPVLARSWDCSLSILGKSKDDFEAKGCSATVHFGDSVYERQQYLEILKAEVDELLKSNAEAMKQTEEAQNREEGYNKELEELKKAQQKELAQLDAVKELRQRHEKEATAVKEQLRKKYGIEAPKEDEDDD